MKQLLKEMALNQLIDCKIEPLEYIHLNGYIDKMTNEQVNKISGAVASRYPKAIANTDAKIQSLNQQRAQNPSQSLAINKQVTKLRAIQNKYRTRGLAWQARLMNKKVSK